MKKQICGVVTTDDAAVVAAARGLVDLFEIRMDLIGANWPEVAKGLNAPWLACNRLASEGGRWPGAEAARQAELLSALELGAAIVDIELTAPGLSDVVGAVKGRAECLISHHDFNGTPGIEELKTIVRRQMDAGADICKVVTTAKTFDDNLTILKLYGEFPGRRLAAFCMGETGLLSRVLAPLAGAEFTYASLETGKQSAPGQMTAAQLSGIYGLLNV